MLKKFLSDKRGNLALTSAIALVPMMAAVAAAVDYSQISRHTASLQQALDASALATGKKLGTMQSGTQLAEYSEKFFNANLSQLDPNEVTFTYDDTNLSDGTTILLKASYNYPMLFGGFLGTDIYGLDVESLVKAGNDTLEIALVLDNSGSMRNARIAAAQTAGIHLVQQLHTAMAGSNHATPVKFALVPFSGHVNVGSNNINANWMDTTGASPVHHENLNWTDNPIAISQGDGTWKDSSGNWLTRFTLFDDMDGGSGRPISWKGCVESRPYPYFTTDAPATLNTPETMFVPVFAPDEPDSYDGEDEQIYQEVQIPGQTSGALYCKKINNSWNSCYKWNDDYRGNIHSTGLAPNLNWSNYRYDRRRKTDGSGVPYGGYEFAGTTSRGTTETQVVDGDQIEEENYYNNYLDDNNNMPSGVLPRDPAHTGSGANQNKRQDWTWKYKNQSSNTNDTWKGPNAGCTTPAITPLTASKSGMISSIGGMVADGSTNIPLGISWGWRVLSSGAPFTEGRASGTADNVKIMIVMTDGNNSYYTPSSLEFGVSDYNKSSYGSYGYTKSTTVNSEGRLFEGYSDNSPVHSRTEFESAMNEHMLTTCTNAKNDGIKIYSVAFNVANGSSVKTMLENCASTNPKTGTKQYFDATGSNGLSAAFSAIGNDISNLRIAQ